MFSARSLSRASALSCTSLRSRVPLRSLIHLSLPRHCHAPQPYLNCSLTAAASCWGTSPQLGRSCLHCSLPPQLGHPYLKAHALQLLPHSSPAITQLTGDGAGAHLPQLLPDGSVLHRHSGSGLMRSPSCQHSGLGAMSSKESRFLLVTQEGGVLGPRKSAVSFLVVTLPSAYSLSSLSIVRSPSRQLPFSTAASRGLLVASPGGSPSPILQSPHSVSEPHSPLSLRHSPNRQHPL